MTRTPGVRVRMELWLPMLGTTVADYQLAAQQIKDICRDMTEQGFEIVACKDRVTTRKPTP